MTEQTVAMYCFTFMDDLLIHCHLAWAPTSDPRQHLSDAEVRGALDGLGSGAVLSAVGS